MKKKKPYFLGKYYKLIDDNGFAIAIIISESLDGPELQLITPNKAYVLIDKKSIKVIDDDIIFAVKEKDLTISGKLTLGQLHPLKRLVMGPFRFFKLECIHSVYSMFHDVHGEIIFNDVKHTYNHGYGYIEGDKGVNFPKKYIWYNSIKPHYGLTLAIASIPFGLITFTGVLCFIKDKNNEYYLCTYNFVKLKKVARDEIILKKGKYQLNIKILTEGGHMLKAPNKGTMIRYIKENISIPSSFTFKKKDQIILNEQDDNSSLEYMFD